MRVLQSSKEFVLGEEVPIGETNYISWVTKRSIRQSEFYVYRNMLDYLEYVKVFGMHVKRVTFVRPHMEESGPDTLIAALSYCECLESLQMFNVLNSEAPLAAIRNCSSLRELRVELLDDPWDLPARSVYPVIPKGVPPLQLSTVVVKKSVRCALELLEMASPASLQSLQVSLSWYFEANDLHAQLSMGYDLKALCLSGWLNGEKLIGLLSLCTNLRHLDVDGFFMDRTLTLQQSTQLAVQLSRISLEVLRLGDIWYAKELLTELAVHGCNTLRVLLLDNCSFEGDSINNIASVCTGLTEFKVLYIGSDKFAAIDLQQLRHLTHLMLGLSDDLHVKTVLDCVAIYCTKLTYLALAMDASDPCDISSLYDSNVLPVLAVLNLCHTELCDTSALQMHRPKLRIGQADDPHWHSFEDIVCNEGYKVW